MSFLDGSAWCHRCPAQSQKAHAFLDGAQACGHKAQDIHCGLLKNTSVSVKAAHRDSLKRGLRATEDPFTPLPELTPASSQSTQNRIGG